jgi:hypothetical protein
MLDEINRRRARGAMSKSSENASVEIGLGIVEQQKQNQPIYAYSPKKRMFFCLILVPKIFEYEY